ncbi:hypothetical protein B0H10DRAFT_569320, partial [Mycena sp. CBHHK59/15]
QFGRTASSTYLNFLNSPYLSRSGQPPISSGKHEVQTGSTPALRLRPTFPSASWVRTAISHLVRGCGPFELLEWDINGTISGSTCLHGSLLIFSSPDLDQELWRAASIPCQLVSPPSASESDCRFPPSCALLYSRWQQRTITGLITLNKQAIILSTRRCYCVASDLSPSVACSVVGRRFPCLHACRIAPRGSQGTPIFFFVTHSRLPHLPHWH